MTFLNVIAPVDENGTRAPQFDPDELVYLRFRAPDEATWREISVLSILPPASGFRIGEYWAQLYDLPDLKPGESLSPREERAVVREIRAELSPPRDHDEGATGGPVYVRACAGAFDLLKNAGSELRAENERLSQRLREREDESDRLRRELHEAREKILELEAKINELEDELDEGDPLGTVISMVTQIVQQETQQGTKPADAPPAPPATGILPPTAEGAP